MFGVTVLLDEAYSFDYGQNGQTDQLNQSDHLDQTELTQDEKYYIQKL